MNTQPMQLLDYLPTIADFPKPGIQFRDISLLLGDPAAFADAIGHIRCTPQRILFKWVGLIYNKGKI